MTPPRNILVAVAWPYASGSRHIGHLAGAYLPGDIFARFHRSVGNNVLMVSGSDVHGTPITVRADAEGVEPQDIVDRYHQQIVAEWEALGFDWDLFTTTGTANHHAVTKDMFMRLYENGHIDRRTSSQFYDPEVERFLPDRYVEGTCPHCLYAEARGDQCENCGRTLDPIDLVNPRSKLSGATPVERDTDHFYLRLSDFEADLGEWLRSRDGWRKHVLNFAIGWIDEGLRDAPITRDIDWGVDIPIDDLGPGKKIYVWFDAVIGYLSAAKEWATSSGDPEAWRQWWENPEAEHFYFIGKDNITFHAITWPAMLMGYGGLNLPTDIPANQYVTFGGGKASSSRGVGMTIGEALSLFEPDALRYAMASNLPETSDADVNIEELARRVNDELVATWGNLVNRVVSMTHRYFDGVVPAAKPDADDLALLEGIGGVLDRVAVSITEVRLRGALSTAMLGAQDVNTYLSRVEPWKTAKTDLERTGTTLAVAIDAIASLAVAFFPYMPVTSRRTLEMLGVDVADRSPHWHPIAVPAGTTLGDPIPLFAKVELPPE